ncbi:thioredoxin-like negative regulator of GroEL [Staphylococcus auricularis]|uniref:Thioredoxin n=1 Tax=Staphylococcus auricularis TaxID=29379 RepID=A0AAP8TT74_9STAP|nr:thioredoxin family protein [Staphylococcus auricularis]MCG7342445.1 thioredoxin family protein [Staphylococcus auricularis]MDC6327914.1 thioredoxin family protein [Staphylococcus auricularis]MDN4533893.1 thioredoxin family protein [Staphylococcus auricularis]PNZ67715.1 thioredoxin [Staphylococcus auricularis]QPT05766.1 thioredoxin family protein [Staphylococcus auricularis]
MTSISDQLTNPEQNFSEDKHLIFGYTPTCGTCKISERMLDVANELAQLPLIKLDLNFHPEFSQQFEIQSVPVLLIMSQDQECDRVYAFQSVPDLLEKLK